MPISSSTVPLAGISRKSTLGALEWVALVLMIVGGLNWGLVGLFGIDLVAAIFGTMTVASRIVYGLVGLAALYGIAMALKQGRQVT